MSVVRLEEYRRYAYIQASIKKVHEASPTMGRMRGWEPVTRLDIAAAVLCGVCGEEMREVKSEREERVASFLYLGY